MRSGSKSDARTALVTVAAAVVLAVGVAVAPRAVADTAQTATEQTYGVAIQRNVGITMSDGVELSANIYRPSDPTTGEPAAGKFPVILTLTPYGKSTAETDPTSAALGMGLVPQLVDAGYVQVVVDVRGTGSSQGTWSFEQPRESVDAAAIVAWVASLPYSTGNVGMIGASYGGLDQLLTAGRIGPGSALKAIMPIIPGDDMYRDVIASGGIPNPLVATMYDASNGVQNQAHAIQDGLSTISSASDVAPLVSVLLQHLGGIEALPATDLITGGPASYDNSYWANQRVHDVLGGVVANGIPAMILGGWRDAFQRGEPLIYAGLQNAAAKRPIDAPMTPTQKVSPNYQLVQGPWYHATLGQTGSTPLLDVSSIALAWFDHWLKGIENGITKTNNPLHSYNITDHRWTQSTSYPFAGAAPSRLYPDADGNLSTTQPSTAGSDTIAWSPLTLCTPSITQFVLIGNDQHEAESNGLPGSPCNSDDRGTQLPPSATTYTTAPLTQPRTIAGPISAHIVATVSSLDSEWVVRVEDVAPDGTSLPLTRGVLLGSHRALDPAKTWTAADGSMLMPYHPFTAVAQQYSVPGTTHSYDVEVFPTHATIAAGHRLRITIGSDDAPVVVPTPTQTLSLVGGTYQIQRGGIDPSYVVVPFAQNSDVGTACTDSRICP